MTLISCYLSLIALRQKGIKDGMPIAGTAMIGVFFGIVILIIIAFQLYSMYTDNDKKE